jgi:hypothetical protein
VSWSAGAADIPASEAAEAIGGCDVSPEESSLDEAHAGQLAAAREAASSIAGEIAEGDDDRIAFSISGSVQSAGSSEVSVRVTAAPAPPEEAAA